MLEQRQGFRGDSGSIAQRLIQALASLALLLKAQTGWLGRGPGSGGRRSCRRCLMSAVVDRYP